MTTLLYDIELRRPACVLLQAAAGGDQGLLMRLFDAKHWLTHPTPGMQLIDGTWEQWERAAEVTERHALGKTENGAPK